MADALLDDLDDLSDVQSDTEPSDGDVYSEGNTRGGNYDDDNYRRGNNDESGGDYNDHRDAMSGVGGDPSAVSSSSSLRVRPRLLDDSSLQLHISSVRAVSNREDDEDKCEYYEDEYSESDAEDVDDENENEGDESAYH